jgi:hypothetical protein
MGLGWIWSSVGGRPKDSHVRDENRGSSEIRVTAAEGSRPPCFPPSFGMKSPSLLPLLHRDAKSSVLLKALRRKLQQLRKDT